MAPGWKFDQILPEITAEAVRQIHELSARPEPFFLYFSQTSPHEPVVPSAKFKGQSGIAPIADFVMETDWSAGQVIEAIDRAGIADNTIVIFTADNGHSHYTGWQDLVDAGHLPSGPYRGHKGDIWEGGHRVPLVVRWPQRIAAGTVSDRLVSLTDVFATCAEVIGGQLPSRGAEDSVSFLSAALGEKDLPPRSPIVNHSNHGEFAYRDGNWKLVYRNRSPNLEQSRGKDRVAELYDLGQDIAEDVDLAGRHPDVVKRLRQGLEQLIKRGATRDLDGASNDAEVRFDVTQSQRWAEPRQ